MSRVKKENYIVIQGWMISDLKLKGNELIIYAIIYGFSQTENQRFTGSLQYLADWTRSTKQGVIKNLKSLADKGLIVKYEKKINNVKFCEYHVTNINRVLNKCEQGIKQSLTGGIKQSLPNNIDIDKKEYNIEDKVNYQRIVDMYNDTCVSFPRLRSLSDSRKRTLKARLKMYSYEDFKTLFAKAEASSFLKGANNRDWSATFDWLIKDANMAKVLDGNYDDFKEPEDVIREEVPFTMIENNEQPNEALQEILKKIRG